MKRLLGKNARSSSHSEQDGPILRGQEANGLETPTSDAGELPCRRDPDADLTGEHLHDGHSEIEKGQAECGELAPFQRAERFWNDEQPPKSPSIPGHPGQVFEGVVVGVKSIVVVLVVNKPASTHPA